MSDPDERTAPAECPVCGADVPPRALSCPHCGADERTGWHEDSTRYDGVDLPDSAFADENTPPARPARRTGTGLHPFWWVVATALLLWFILGALSPF